MDQNNIFENFSDILAAEKQTISIGETVTGHIVNKSPYSLYTFSAEKGDIIRASLEHTNGNLDPFLVVLNENSEILRNDDDSGEDRNALIDQLVIPESSNYILLITRYGQVIGNTEGTYTLTLTQEEIAVTSSPLIDVDLPEGVIEASLVWNTNADLQLLVRDSIGENRI